MIIPLKITAMNFSQSQLKKTRPKLSTSALLLSLSIGSSNAQLQNGLLSYWDFENNFNDTADSYSTDGTVADNGTGGTGVVFKTEEGKLGTYGDFERTGLGTENLVVVPDSADLIAAGEDLTISAWFRIDGLNQDWQGLLAHGEDSDWRISRRRRENGISYAGGTADNPGAGITPDVNDGAWHHVVAITENGVSTRIWIDGRLVNTSTGAPTIADNGSGALYIGGNPQAYPDNTDANQFRPWNGGIDDVALWNRVLSDEEIGQIYSFGDLGVSLNAILSPGDADNDGLGDAWEDANGLSSQDDGSIDINNGPDGDPDNDNSDNAAEFANGTNPQNPDSDDDGSDDGAEAANGTNPNDPDTDGDSLLDGHETNTDVFVDETDTGTDPLESDLTADSDLDGLINLWEIQNGLEPFDDGATDPNNGAEGDPDADESSNLNEQTNGTDPQDADSDDDNSLDGAEATNGTDPLNPDTDGDTLIDGIETNTGNFVDETDTGTNPTEPDSDLDGFTDNAEIALGTDPNDLENSPTPAGLTIFDDFEDGAIDFAIWNTITRTVSQNDDATITGGTITEADGSLEFGSRGYLYTQNQFDPEAVGGLEITGEFTFLTGEDVFTVITRGKPTPAVRYGEAESGVQFQISVHRNVLQIVPRNGDHIITDETIEGGIDFAANVVYTFKVIDDGVGGLSLTVNEKDAPENMMKASAEITSDTSDTNHIIFYNRENGRNTQFNEVEIKSYTTAERTRIQDIAFNPSEGDNGIFTLTWTSREIDSYSIFASPDMINWQFEVADGIQGLNDTTSFSFDHPAPGTEELFFRVELTGQ